MPGGQTFLPCDLGLLCPQLKPPAPAHPKNPLRTWLLWARELLELARGHQGSGELPGLVGASAAFLAWSVGGGRDEREEGRGEKRETK